MDAHTTIAQIGPMATAMMGLSFMVAPDALYVTVGRNPGKVSKVKITLDPDDTYRMAFYTGKGLNIRQRGEWAGIYAEDLTRILSAETKLSASL